MVNRWNNELFKQLEPIGEEDKHTESLNDFQLFQGIKDELQSGNQRKIGLNPTFSAITQERKATEVLPSPVNSSFVPLKAYSTFDHKPYRPRNRQNRIDELEMKVERIESQFDKIRKLGNDTFRPIGVGRTLNEMTPEYREKLKRQLNNSELCDVEVELLPSLSQENIDVNIANTDNTNNDNISNTSSDTSNDSDRNNTHEDTDIANHIRVPHARPRFFNDDSESDTYGAPTHFDPDASPDFHDYMMAGVPFPEPSYEERLSDDEDKLKPNSRQTSSSPSSSSSSPSPLPSSSAGEGNEEEKDLVAKQVNEAGTERVVTFEKPISNESRETSTFSLLGNTSKVQTEWLDSPRKEVEENRINVGKAENKDESDSNDSSSILPPLADLETYNTDKIPNNAQVRAISTSSALSVVTSSTIPSLRIPSINLPDDEFVHIGTSQDTKSNNNKILNNIDDKSLASARTLLNSTRSTINKIPIDYLEMLRSQKKHTNEKTGSDAHVSAVIGDDVDERGESSGEGFMEDHAINMSDTVDTKETSRIVSTELILKRLGKEINDEL
ncbi:Mnd2p NDAI_0G04430 [Naumovozyma dairenensis CBS 421]|uniref:Uncharacterized protein n=1 Tax=Naumovozyma dairenensis (strain ATCC 10597 / BCRC 20456 / CBS 421 / NBRC 0211 / NRRL Y-12639) TaxID=1071378 RepID=J7SAZ7_NAUDC|nr:hypothetical protein NDAI_0G04430 [Naumovozyma dairenensis CBS 421]CCK73428.1 hypothetical protein NDAI_0G04430 [Naumovozyma dairenensis CBS 421]